jgi:hypothetical protein
MKGIYHLSDLREDTLDLWEDSINMDVKETAFEGVKWIHVPQDRIQ